MLRNLISVIVILFMAISGGLCSELKAEGARGGINLSFDDTDVDSWYRARYLFIKYNAHVTFYVSHIDSLSEDQIKKLLILQNDGNEIASHSLHHKDIMGIITGGGYGEDSEVGRYIREDVNPSIKIMSQKGMHPIDYAVPFSRRVPAYLNALKEKFYFVRVGAWMPDGGDITKAKEGYYTCNDQINNRRLIKGFGIDNAKFSLDTIILALRYAKQTNSVVSMNSHSINESGVHGIKIEELEAILKTASQLGLKFYTTIELRTYCI